MATLPTNSFQTVQTYQRSNLAYLQNLNCFIHTANTKFKNFDTLEANQGDTVTFDLPPRFRASNSLVATFQGSTQRVESLTVDQAKNVAVAYTNQQQIFNLDRMGYFKTFGKAAVQELSAEIESNVAQKTCAESSYRFFGDGITPLNSYNQLAKMISLFKNYGAASGDLEIFLPDTVIPDIVATGHNQFTIDRNNKSAMSWMVGDWNGAMFNQSNLLPIHTAGTVGNDQATLTVVSTDDPTGANITQITFSGAGTDALAVLENDRLEFQDGVAGQPNLRYLTFVGHKPSANPVQLRITADSASSAGNVTVSITPALVSVPGKNQNIVNNIVAGMQAKILPTHRAGTIISDNALFLAMPQLPDESPFTTVNEADKDTGVSLRMYMGALFGQNQRGMVTDCIWGSKLPDEYGMSIITPV